MRKKLILLSPCSPMQLPRGHAITRALLSLRPSSVEIVSYGLVAHSEVAVAKLLYVLREGTPAARHGFGLSSEYYSAAFAAAREGPAIEPDDMFLSFHQIAPKQVMRLAAAGQCRVAAYVDLSLSEYLRTYGITQGIPARVRDRLRAQERECMSLYDRLFVFDEASRREMIAEFGIDSSRVVVLGRGVNLTKAQLATIRAGRRARTRDGMFHLLFVGVDAGRKGLDEIIGGIDDLSLALRARVRLHVVGPKPGDVAKRPFIIAHGFLDPERDVNALAAVSACADVGVMLTEAEGGTPSAILEYLSCGMPAIVTSLPRIRDFLESHAVLFVNPENRRSEFAALLRRLLQQPEELTALSAKAEAHKDCFSWKPVGEKLINAVSTLPSQLGLK